MTPSGSYTRYPRFALAAVLWCATRSVRSAEAAFCDQYFAESSATKISANRASTRGLPDSRTTASANSLREAMIRSPRARSLAQRSRIETFAHSLCAARPRETISGRSDGGVFSNWPTTAPVAGLIEGSVSMGMAVAAITEILTDFAPRMCAHNMRPVLLTRAAQKSASTQANDRLSERRAASFQPSRASPHGCDCGRSGGRRRSILPPGQGSFCGIHRDESRPARNHREHRRVADSTNLPLCSPAAEGPIQRPSQKREEDYDEHGEKEQVLCNVMEDVVPHLMAHHGLNLLGRSAPQEIVVERDAHGLAIPADVCAHARGLARRVHLVDLLRGNSISASEAQDRLGDPRIIQHREFVEDREDEDWCNHHREDHEHEGDDGAPDRPTARPAADHAKKQDSEDSNQYDVHQKYFELIAKPGPESLRCKPVLAFTKESFVNGKRSAEDGSEHQEFRPVNQRLLWLESRDAFGKIAHSGRPTEVEQQEIERNTIKKIPKDQPISAFKIGVGFRSRIGRNLRQVRVRGSLHVKMV